MKVICSFCNKCKNYNKECNHCKWNAANKIGDYLLLEDKDGKSIRFL